MENLQNMRRKYAEAIIQVGVNVQNGQPVCILSDIENASFARELAEAAYHSGASRVHISWQDERLHKLTIDHAPPETLSSVPDWLITDQKALLKEGAAFIKVLSINPDLLDDSDPERIGTYFQSLSKLDQVMSPIQNKIVPFTIAGAPSKGWAKKLFPDLSDDQAIEKLWAHIFDASRIDDHSVIDNWQKHIAALEEKAAKLNHKKYKALHLKAPGTDLVVELADEHQWVHAGETTKSGQDFVANIPTEEVFTIPKKTGVQGTVTNTKPLNLNGGIVDQFTLTFENGKITDVSAKKGEEVLKSVLETDEGARYLGEIALVPDDSPISNKDLLFFNTLYDENASCHLAIGRGIPFCLKNGENMTEEELLKAGTNVSMIHIDFMVGSAEMDIDGIKEDGTKEPTFRKGNWT
ncbi:MAG: aminopeptidase [Bacillaceae bacterium]|nr:aminopeptidase [Bacillaceae bacterium]